jgi:hypothetical protein
VTERRSITREELAAAMYDSELPDGEARYTLQMFADAIFAALPPAADGFWIGNHGVANGGNAPLPGPVVGRPKEVGDALRTFGEAITEIGMRALHHDLEPNEISAAAFLARNVLSWTGAHLAVPEQRAPRTLDLPGKAHILPRPAQPRPQPAPPPPREAER